MTTEKLHKDHSDFENDPSFSKIIGINISSKSYLTELFLFRELLYYMSLRDILVRYRQSFFGIAWALLKPLMTMLFFTLVFNRIAHLSSQNVNYSLFVLAGMLPWQLFSGYVVEVTSSLVNHGSLITKVYFPRVIIPLSQLAIHILDFAVGFTLLFILAFFAGFGSLWVLLSVLPFFLLCSLLCIGCGLFLSALTAKYRDFRIIVPFLVQFGIFISPIGYGSFLIPDKWAYFYALNPMVGIIDGFRWALFGISPAHFSISIISSISITFFILVTGFIYFRKMERTFVDTI